MRTKDLIDLAADPNLISGIYNYCDRWCERCPFSSRCLVYLTEREDDDGDPASRDITNAVFWKKLASIFEQTQEMLTTWAEENGVSLSPKEIASAAKQNETSRAEALDHPLSKSAQAYAKAVSKWFEKIPSELDVISDTLEDSETSNSEDSDDELDAEGVIRWYQFFIAAKIARGLISRVHEQEYEADANSLDSDGSIKAALIAIDRSISAWKLMGELRAERAKSIRTFLIELERLRLSTEKTFPRARQFIRPGFDEVGLDQIN